MAEAFQTINLLPDEKQKLLRVQRINALVVGGSIVILVVVVAAIILLTSAIGAAQFALDQKKKEITNTKSQIAVIDKLDDGSSLEKQATTLQNQLAQLATAYAAKDKRQFALSLQRVSQIVPPTVSLTSANVDQSGSVTVSGSAKSYNDVSRFAEALKQDGAVINIPGVGADTQPLVQPSSYFTNVQIQSVSFGTSSSYTYNIIYTLGQGAENAQ